MALAIISRKNASVSGSGLSADTAPLSSGGSSVPGVSDVLATPCLSRSGVFSNCNTPASITHFLETRKLRASWSIAMSSSSESRNDVALVMEDTVVQLYDGVKPLVPAC